MRTAVIGMPLLASLLGVPGPAWGETEPGATLTFVPPPAEETMIVVVDPPASELPAAPAPAEPELRPPAERPMTTTPTTVRADSPALRALVEASGAERRRLRAQIPDLEARVAAMEAGLGPTQGAVSARQAEVDALEVRLARASWDLEEAEAEVSRMELSAASAADAERGQRTPVARPPAKGHSPQDHAAQARHDLAAAVDTRLRLSRVLVELRQESDPVLQAASTATSELTAKIEELDRAREALAQLRQQLAAAEQAAPHISAAPSSALATATVPTGYLWLYGRAAATCAGMPWTVLAAVGSVESAHGQSTAPGVHSGQNFAGAQGPMQFLADTWAAYGVDGDGDGVRNVYNPADAIFGAANYLCARGAGNLTTLRSALWHYNHADWYVEQVLELAALYSS